jgi:alkyl sulfatase BDS1-like metallo-beta-lactamase superfamily hydrolase
LFFGQVAAERLAGEIDLPRLSRLGAANSHGVVQRYLGFWDCNPTTLIPLSLGAALRRDVGRHRKDHGASRDLHEKGKYLLASEIVNKLVLAEPENQEAKDLLAHIFEQLGYQRPTAPIRTA